MGKKRNKKSKKKPGLLRRAFFRVRLLPVVIFVSVLMLTVRVSDIWVGVDVLLNGELSVASAQAQQQTPPADAPPTAEMPAPTDAAAPDPLMATEPLDVPSEDRAAIAARMLSDDPTLLTQTEIDLLQKLAERREELNARARELETRQAMLQAAEARIDSKINDFQTLKTTLDGLIKSYDTQQGSKLESLVKIYENMKPKDAARIFEELDMPTLLMVAERMKERSLAPVMAKMNPIKAREMTVELSRLRELPRPGAELAEKGG